MQAYKHKKYLETGDEFGRLRVIEVETLSTLVLPNAPF